MWVTAEDPEPVERQEPDIFGVVTSVKRAWMW
jgi:hypothetical protein